MADNRNDYPAFNDQFNLEKFPYYWLSRVNSRYLKSMEATLHALDFDNSRRRILYTLSAKQDLSISEIVAYTDMKISTVTKLVYKLEDEGFLETYTSTHDRRVKMVSIRPLGIDTVQAIYEGTRDMLSKSLEGIPEEDIDSLNAILMKIFNNLPE